MNKTLLRDIYPDKITTTTVATLQEPTMFSTILGLHGVAAWKISI
jgi:hypothetical protein